MELQTLKKDMQKFDKMHRAYSWHVPCLIIAIVLPMTVAIVFDKSYFHWVSLALLLMVIWWYLHYNVTIYNPSYDDLAYDNEHIVFSRDRANPLNSGIRYKSYAECTNIKDFRVINGFIEIDGDIKLIDTAIDYKNSDVCFRGQNIISPEDGEQLKTR